MLRRTCRRLGFMKFTSALVHLDITSSSPFVIMRDTDVEQVFRNVYLFSIYSSVIMLITKIKKLKV